MYGYAGNLACQRLVATRSFGIENITVARKKHGSTQGGRGIRIDTLIEQIYRFMEDHPGELVILDINDEAGYNTGLNEAQLPKMNKTHWEPILDQFKTKSESRVTAGLPSERTKISST